MKRTNLVIKRTKRVMKRTKRVTKRTFFGLQQKNDRYKKIS